MILGLSRQISEQKVRPARRRWLVPFRLGRLEKRSFAMEAYCSIGHERAVCGPITGEQRQDGLDGGEQIFPGQQGTGTPRFTD